MDYHYDSHRDYYIGEGVIMKNSYFAGGILIFLGILGLANDYDFPEPYISILYLILGSVQIIFPKWVATFSKHNDFVKLNEGILSWHFKKNKGEASLSTIKSVERLVGTAKITLKDEQVLFLPSHMIKSKSKFLEFDTKVLPYIQER